MSTVIIASQAPPPINAVIARHLPDGAELVPIPAGDYEAVPKDAIALIPSPRRLAGGADPGAPPEGWPFNLKYVQLMSAGIDAYPAWLFDTLPVASIRGVSSTALAEFALAAIFAAAKRFPDIWIKSASEWGYRPLALVEGATWGVVGFGAIGEALAPKALALGMKVIATRKSDAPLGVPGVERATLEAVVAAADHLLLAAPATPDTYHLINSDLLAKAKPGQHLINIARGTLIDDAALIGALDSGRLSLATLDVAHPEPLPDGHPFYTHPKVRLSPHTSVLTPDMLDNIGAFIGDNLERHIKGEPLANLLPPGRGY